MIKELSLLTTALSVYTGGGRSTSRNKVVVDDGVQITYKYDTNDVSSNEDIIVGNCYYVDIEDFHAFSENQDFMFFVIAIEECSPAFDYTQDNYMDEVYLEEIESDGSFIACFQPDLINFYWGNDAYISYAIEQEGLFIRALIVVYEYNQKSESAFYSFSSGVGSLPIESVERYYPDNIFGYVSDFIDSHILNGIPNIDDVSYTIGNKNITLRSWLNTSICVVLAVLLITFLIWVVRYFFRLFSGLLH